LGATKRTLHSGHFATPNFTAMWQLN